jgi:hypothetical protein
MLFLTSGFFLKKKKKWYIKQAIKVSLGLEN